MKSKENGLLGNLLNWGARRQQSAAEGLYEVATEKARNPVFYTDFGVKDDIDGRFDALSLIVGLVMRRLKGCGDAGKVTSQQMFDAMFADMDLTLREMGAGDIGVSKRVRVMAEAFLGRLDAYSTALDTKNDANYQALGDALTRNLLRGSDASDPKASGLVEHVLALALQLDKVPDAKLLAGSLAE